MLRSSRGLCFMRVCKAALVATAASAIFFFALAAAAQENEGQSAGPLPPGLAAPTLPTAPPAAAETVATPPLVANRSLAPDYPAFGSPRPAIPKVRASSTMMTAGILMTTGGILLVIAGSVITASAIDVVDIYCDGPAVCLHRDDTVKKGVGSVMLGGGAVIGAVGFPMWLIGGRMVPVKNSPQKTGFFAPDVRVGVGNAKVTFSF
jgi:hypothetical protein